MFTTRYGDRPDAHNLCIVLTDGKSYDPVETAQQAQLVSLCSYCALTYVT